MSKAKSQGLKASPVHLSKKRVAQRYGICTRSVNNWVDSGALPQPVRFTRQTILWPVAVLDAHDRQRQAAAAIGLEAEAAA